MAADALTPSDIVPWTEVRLVRATIPKAGRAAIAQAADVFRLLRAVAASLPAERFWVLPLDRKNKPLAILQTSQGTVDASLVHPRDVFAPAIVSNAAGVIVAHNHPSGDPEPSPEDLAVTRRLAAAGQTLGISLLDHVIIGATGYVSLAERGLL